ncbi:aldose 1-epimerase [Rhodoferax sp. OV413]|uniref:aldose 1-epimerase n=1 Tax=Rhodoferax sp. OV413 TaxID=1855285 RepID=UPI0008892174|nr:aldose 1-epimerase [Rhodoferax sp. OV413]SDO81774.1 aldose 1-epimerase [Rhodoferax sp. OV413]
MPEAAQNPVITLHAGGASARLVPHAGGRVSALRLVSATGEAVDVLHPYPEDFFDPIAWAKGGIYPLMPYSNRIANALLRVQGETHALRPHPGSMPHSLHGNAHAQPWQATQSGPETATLTLDSPPGPAWPWHYTASLHFELAPSQLRVGLTLRNADTRTMPAGMGLHPFFRYDPAARLSYRATTLWPVTPDYLAGTARPLRPDEQHARPRHLPQGAVNAYLGGWDGTALVELPQGALLSMQADPLFGHLVVHRPDPPVYLCLEPVSHVADGFNLAARGVADTGTHLLEPGGSLSGEIRFATLPNHL